MKIVLDVVGGLLILVGIGWFLQGINVLGGSMMSGQTQWAIIGGLAAILGIGLIVYVNRGRANTPKA